MEETRTQNKKRKGEFILKTKLQLFCSLPKYFRLPQWQFDLHYL